MLTVQDLEKFDYYVNESLSCYTYTKVGGPADFLVFPRTEEEVSALLKLARETATPVTVLGNASNLIVRDGGIRGLVLMLERLHDIRVTGSEIKAGAGASLIELTKVAQAHALSGLEFAAGIPGSVGGAVYMNAGAYGSEISAVFSSARVMDLAGKGFTLTADEIAFAYRYSIIRERQLTVVSASFSLAAGDSSLIQTEMNRVNQLRALKQPLDYPSCGSVFKRPDGYFAGPLIQAAGCQGHRIGGVEVSTKHAGFMVNVDRGTASDYEKLIAWVIEKVRQNSGVVLEPEVKIIGEP